MNIGKILNLIADNNINPEDVFSLVEEIKSTNLKDEQNLRNIIRRVAKLANRPIDKSKEDSLVKKILNEGIDEDIFGMI
ncbi:MAG TPA: stage VI sporulation protein F [Acholeplasmataceae bacterium]|jgi:Flp pilus assembly CpaF family ATPase|nr:stage VI sporulation protein F [Acholeplasmataceae bacterium]